MKILRFYAKGVDIGFLIVLINCKIIEISFIMRKMKKKWKNFLEQQHYIIYNS